MHAHTRSSTLRSRASSIDLGALLSAAVTSTLRDSCDASARLAASLCGTPAALIVIGSPARHVVVGASGIAGDALHGSIASCALAIETAEPVWVPDATADPRMAGDAVLAVDASLRAQCAVPMAPPGGTVVGACVVLGPAGCEIPAGAVANLQTLAAQIGLAVHALAHEQAGAQALRQMPDGYIALDSDIRVLQINDAGARLFGLDREQTIGRPLHEVAAQAPALGVSEKLRPLAADPQHPPFTVERALGDGRRRVELRAMPSDGGVALFARDVTARRAASERYRLLDTCVRHLDDVVVMITDAQASPPGPRILFTNAASVKLCGYTPEELIGRSPRLLQGPLTQRDRLSAIRHAIVNGQPIETELVNYKRNGEMYWVEVKITPIFDDEGRCTNFVAVERDITQRKRAQEQRQALEGQLRQAQKIESIGTLAGGIAHDFNNILGTILGNVSLLKDALPAEGAARAHLGHIYTASLRARALVQQILTFGRQQDTQRVEQPLAPLVEETLRLLGSTLPASVSLESRITATTLWALVDATQMQQVLLNLCTNAWHALPERGGSIVVGLDETRGGEHETPSGTQAHLWVADTGSGIDEATRARMFEPFFTTKPAGQGTGLGLSVAHGIVLAHQGRITVDSETGRGSVFHIYLPAHRHDSTAITAPSPSPPVTPSTEQLRVLCVDDDEVVLITLGALLERVGCSVTSFHDPVEALAALRRSPQSFDLVVTDQTMPGLSGIDLAQAVNALPAPPPVVLISGFVGDELRDAARQCGVWQVVHKERCDQELVEVVARAAATRAARRNHGR